MNTEKKRLLRASSSSFSTNGKKSTSLNRTLGPVPDLERHLPQDWWRTLFDSIYLKTDGDVVENLNATKQEVDGILSVTELNPNDILLDLCCGQGRHCLELARRGFHHLTGVDRSRYLVRLARRRAKQESLKIAFHEGDARRFRSKELRYQCVMVLGNSFGYFDKEDDDKSVLQTARAALHGGGILVLDLADGDWQRQNFMPRSWEWIDENHFVCRERAISADQSRLISREVVVHAERGVIVDQFYAERLYSQDAILALLEECGFDHCRIHDPILTQSSREQDLGMMASRMLLTARSKRPSKSVRSKGSLFSKIAVLLGDPRLPDACKRDGRFNVEDIETVEKMKDAVAKLPQYHFDYLDNHISMLSDLRSLSPDFVFNLCDEGYDNDAFKELHVPAILEMLNIPYSGSGPSTLGLCYNKSLVRSIAASLDIPVPLETYFDPDDQSATLPSVFPALIKPNFGDSSVGITAQSIVDTPSSLVTRVEELHRQFQGAPLLIQEFLTGDEYSLGIIGNPGFGYLFLPVLKVDYSGLDEGLVRILGYESKWLPDSPYWTQIRYCEATIDEDTTRQLCDWGSLLFERLGCRDYARFDFRADADGTIKLLEVNPNPGWCWDGKLNLMAGFAGMSYTNFFEAILDAAHKRYAVNGKCRR
jgi:D-alanine-D-alanine ligase